ncbi:serine/threonine protein kinase [Apiospora hydei]|uniref:Serine/threonine protein kinase n=1 Tax=Apiospora hydei TaxID=1337664 RepID=A0ABR1UTX8_9PEZI
MVVEHTARNEDEVLTVPLRSDVWSLGAVFSELIIWLAEGIDGIDNFEKRRKQETSTLPGFRGSGFETCFHNGVKRLNCVDEIHTESLGLLIRLDNITPLIKRLTEDYMLVHMENRLDAKPLFQFFVNEIAKLPPIPN